MIYPTLFIGLGSTGLDILERFQELVLEHYGRASLDIFRYIAIETREAAEVRPSEWGKNEIKLLKPIVENTEAIKNLIDSGHKQYLKDWLNMELLKIAGGQFRDGASNIRMAGRLILWENWDSIKGAINDAYNQITSNKNRGKTRVFLRRHYKRHGQPIDNKNPLVGALPNVYIVGTLCGGTCSGMFIDIGYYIKQITGLWASNLPKPNLAKVIGIFSIFDSATLNSARQASTRLHAANCWAALMEYDFFCHSQTRYQATFPDGTYINTNERPIDWLYLISCTATDCDNKLRSNFRKGDGSPDEESLNHMAATLLFTETVGNLLGTKEAIRTDYRGNARAIQCNGNEHSSCIATCGIATIWYPKYRIALGAACKYGASLCSEWMGEVDPNTKQIIENESSDRWNNMLRDRVDELTSSASGTIIGDVGQEFDNNRDKYLNLPTSQFKDLLYERISLLNKEGRYDAHITERVGKFKDKLRKDIYDFIENIINRQANLAYAEYYLEQLDKAIADTIGRLPSEYPVPDLSRVNEPSSDTFSRLVFKAKEVEGQRKEDILSGVKGYMENHIKKIRNFRMRAVLEEIREEIGIGKNLPEDKVRAGMHTVKEHLDNVKKTISDCIKHLEGRYNDLSGKLALTQDVRAVFGGSPGLIKDDIDRVVAQLMNISLADKESILNNIKDAQNLAQFLGFGKEGKTESIKSKMREKLIREILERIRFFNVIDYVLSNWRASEIADFAEHGLPHLELTPGISGLASVIIGRPVSFVAGGDEQGLNSLLQDKLTGTPCDGLFRSDRSPIFLPEISHMVIFYREEPLMYMDDNLATATLFEGCYRDAEKASVYGLHTHKGGKSVFDPRVVARRNKTENELMPIAIKILSARDEKMNWTSSDVFLIERGQLVLRGVRKSGRNFRFTGDKNGIEICAQDEEIYKYFYKLVEEKLTNMTRDDLIKRINNYLEWIEKKTEAEGKDPGPVMQEEEKKIMEIGMIKEHFPQEVSD